MSSRKKLRATRTVSFRQTGLTLIEIMIALLLGVFVIAGVTGMFLSAKQSYRVQEALSRLQENGRFAMDFIGKSIRQADYRNCPDDRVNSLFAMSGVAAISGTNGAGTNADSLTLAWTLGACGTAPPTQDIYDITVLNNPTNTLDPNYKLPVLRKTNVQLIEGVENMQVFYGVDTDADSSRAPNFYTNNPTAAQMEQVTSIRVSLLLRTVDNNVAAKPLAYTYNGNKITPPAGDLYIRRVFTSTFGIRNRLP